ncbi:uncharacterized protein LOC132601250 [Lycium barbarum]|uniref:uncharacterized protein LOC132601250 n=1 Tax=Lycium barbarum TaxID=112863 RepID=UPI00293F2B7E|nr:uncharacterized protein LOC132601250 [Lycium barbarum]
MVGKRAVPQSNDAKKTKSLNALQGIAPFNMSQQQSKATIVGDSTGQNSGANQQLGSPKGSPNTNSEKKSWADLIDAAPGEVQNLEIKSESWSKIVGAVPIREGFDLEGDEASTTNVKITLEDIKDEVDYWSTAVICYVLGSNPPQSVMEGYFRRIWKPLGVNKIAQVNRGVFLVRFHNEEDKTTTVEGGVVMFDRKPIVVKPWRPDIEITKETVDKVPIWIRLVGLDIKYWGKSALTKIAGMIGRPLKADRATTHKERLTFARVLVEMPINKEYPTEVRFENEVGRIVEQRVEYEWKPTMCTRCKNFGHGVNECRRQQRDKEWLEKLEKGKKQAEQEEYVVDGNQMVQEVNKKNGKEQRRTPTNAGTKVQNQENIHANLFEVLQNKEDDEVQQRPEFVIQQPSASPGNSKGGGTPHPKWIK